MTPHIDHDAQPIRPSLDVRHNAEAQQFEAVVEGELCRAHYRRTGDVLAMNHTEVPARLSRRGIAAELVRAAIDFPHLGGERVAFGDRLRARSPPSHRPALLVRARLLPAPPGSARRARLIALSHPRVDSHRM